MIFVLPSQDPEAAERAFVAALANRAASAVIVFVDVADLVQEEIALYFHVRPVCDEHDVGLHAEVRGDEAARRAGRALRHLARSVANRGRFPRTRWIC